MDVKFNAAFVTILPKSDNDGVSLSAETAAVLAAVIVRFGAYTAEPVSGEWRSEDGTVYPDDSLRITVFCDAADRADALAIVRDAGRSLRQEAMFFEWRCPVDAEVVDTA